MILVHWLLTRFSNGTFLEHQNLLLVSQCALSPYASGLFDPFISGLTYGDEHSWTHHG
jgi:hypothetical protein